MPMPNALVATTIGTRPEAKASETAVLVHVDTDLEYQSPGGDGWWDVPVAEISELDFTQEARATYDGFKATQRPLL